VKVVAEAPEFDHGETEAKPKPAPSASRIRLIETMANAPPMIAAHDIAETALSAGAKPGTMTRSSVKGRSPATSMVELCMTSLLDPSNARAVAR
jgi:hypothetical protein